MAGEGSPRMAAEDEVDLREYKKSIEDSLGRLKPDSVLLKRIRRLPDRMARVEWWREVEVLNDLLHDELGSFVLDD